MNDDRIHFLQKESTGGTSQMESNDGFEPWSYRKTAILSKYTTSEKLSITTSFLSASEKDKGKTIIMLVNFLAWFKIWF